jgi:cytoskeletal protein RodZ
MANPARVPDPLNPIPPAEADPFTPDARNSANKPDPEVVNRVESRSGGSSVLIAAIVLVLAVIAYFIFAPATENTPPAPDAPATTTTEPATPAPDATAPAAPDATAPAAPATPETPAPDATAPAAPDATAPAPAEPAPAEPAPAPAPAQ